MIKVIKNHFHNSAHVVIDREVWYATSEGLDNDIWNITNYIENMIGHTPTINRTESLIQIGTPADKTYSVWNINS